MSRDSFPIISMTIEGMRCTLKRAFDEHIVKMDSMVEDQLAELTKPDNLRAILAQELTTCLRQEIKEYCRDYLRTDEGREYIKRHVIKRLEELVLSKGFVTRIFDAVVRDRI